MKTLRLLSLLFALTILQSGCSKEEPEDIQPTSAPEVVEKSKRDVTICVLAGAMPDVLETHVKANGIQRVCWKGHGQPYEALFETATWPFVEPAHRTQTDGWSVIDVPADSAGDFFTLNYRLAEGDSTRRHGYRVRVVPSNGMIPPNGPAVIGEG